MIHRMSRLFSKTPSPDFVEEDTERFDLNHYTRLSVRGWMKQGASISNGQLARLALTYAMDNDVDAVALFVWDHPELMETPYTVARVQLAGSGKGWSGDGQWLLGTKEDQAEYATKTLIIERRTIQRM